MTEGQLQEAIRQSCKVRRLSYYHTHNSRKSPAGFPDCVIIVGSTVIYAELKNATRKPTAAQIEWLDALAHTGALVYLWRPEHWLNGTIDRALSLDPTICRGAWWPDGGRWLPKSGLPTRSG